MTDTITFHEAGHAAVCLSLGIPVTRIRVSVIDGECFCDLSTLDEWQHGIVLAAGAAAVEYFLGADEVHGTISDDDRLLELLGNDGRKVAQSRSAALGLVCKLHDEILALKAELDRQPILGTSDLARIVHAPGSRLAAFRSLYAKVESNYRPPEPAPRTSELGVPAGFMRAGGCPIF